MSQAGVDFEEVSRELYKKLWEPWQGNGERPLYHYTTSRGLRGIVESRQLWMTNAAYLNDAHELVESRRLFLTSIEGLLKVRPTTLQQNFLEAMRENLQGYLPLTDDPPNVFVGCFSTERDSLSQWRAYGRGEGGFCISFKADSVWNIKNNSPRKPNYWLLPCEYDAKRLIELSLDCINAAVSRVEAGGDEHDFKVLAQQFLGSISWIGAMVKSVAFKEEREWRVVYYSTTDDLPNVCYRDGSTFTPYIPFSFGSKGDLVGAIKEIVVGPQRHVDLAVHGVRSYLENQLGIEVVVRKSNVPYRDI